MNRARLRELGFELGDHLGGWSQGAWSATAADGTPVVLKWFSEQSMAERYGRLIPALDELRARGLPVPDYLYVGPFEGGTLSAQRLLPGRSDDNPPAPVIESVVACITAQAGLSGPPPSVDQTNWGGFVVHTLTVGREGWAAHEPLRQWSARSAAVLDRVLAVGAAADPAWFPNTGLVHLDLHTDNILIEGDRLTGIIDWEGACAGDPLYDLVQFAFDLDGHDQPVWESVDTAGIALRVLRAYLALLVLKCTATAILHRPEDVPRQLDRAERVFNRYGI